MILRTFGGPTGANTSELTETHAIIYYTVCSWLSFFFSWGILPPQLFFSEPALWPRALRFWGMSEYENHNNNNNNNNKNTSRVFSGCCVVRTPTPSHARPPYGAWPNFAGFWMLFFVRSCSRPQVKCSVSRLGQTMIYLSIYLQLSRSSSSFPACQSWEVAQDLRSSIYRSDTGNMCYVRTAGSCRCCGSHPEKWAESCRSYIRDRE